MNKNLKRALVITGLVMIWMLSGLFSSEQEVQEHKQAIEKVLVKNIVSQTFTPKVNVVGRTEVANSVNVVAEVAGKIESVQFSQGKLVKKGQMLAVLENDYRKNTLESTEQALNAAKLKLKIAKNLSKQAYTAKTDLADRQAQYADAVSNYTNAKRDYENSFVKAPISGFIEEKNIDLGDYVKSDTVLYKIISQDKLYLVAYLSQSQREKVKTGQKAYGILNNKQRLDGRINFISQQADEITKTYKMEVLVDLKNQDMAVVEGLTVEIFVPTEKLTVFKIPHSAMVIHDDGRLGVRVIEQDNTVKFKELDIIEDTHKHLLVQIDQVENSLGLIIRGHVDVADGMIVEVSYSDSKVEKKEENDG